MASRGPTPRVNKPATNGNRNDTYSVDNKSSNGNIVKNIEDVIARNKILEEENNVLRNLIHEENGKTGRFDERRTLMLKCKSSRNYLEGMNMSTFMSS